MTRPGTVGERIAERTRAYAHLPLFRAFREDRIPVARFPDFFKEQFMTARWFQDVIWAATEIREGPYADFAREHRGRDSGHYRWMRHDLWNFRLGAMTEDDWFRPEWLPTRIQMARILARLHGATPEERVIVLACMEHAGGVTLGTLHGYVARHGLEEKTRYLGRAHVQIEERQVHRLRQVGAGLLESADPRHLELVDLVFDALETMFSEGGDRYYAEFLGKARP
jgi:hypothetical protein